MFRRLDANWASDKEEIKSIIIDLHSRAGYEGSNNWVPMTPSPKEGSGLSLNSIEKSHYSDPKVHLQPANPFNKIGFSTIFR